MATMSQTWSILTALTVLAAQLCMAEKSCDIQSSSGSVVMRGSSFVVYCTFKCKCKGSMYTYSPRTLIQNHSDLNSTTIYLNVVNITTDRTYSCECSCSPSLDPCGLDIFTGYPPEPPINISCIYEGRSSGRGVVTCTWKRGRDTYLKDSSKLLVTTVSANRTVGQSNHSTLRNDPRSASFDVSSSVRLISVQVQVENPLRSAVSAAVNYTLSDIEMPSSPLLDQPNCSSRVCILKVGQSERKRHLEIQYATEATNWTSYPDSGGQRSSVEVQRSISSLEPYRLYHFRARSKFSTGLWSPWSANVSGWTQEEAPAKELDVWYAESDSDSLRVYWKEANSSISRGKIIQYRVGVYSQDSALVFVNNTSPDTRNYSVPFCANCEVKVWACNSKGMSPPATITTRYTKAMPSQGVRVTTDRHNVSIWWEKPNPAAQSVAYVVEWYPEGHKLEELRWLRLDREQNHTIITGINPLECYEGALYAFYNESSVHRTRFRGVTTVESAPTAGPSVRETVEGNRVTVTWTEIPRGQRGGCIIKYTIYLENDSGPRKPYSVEASERMYVLTLPPAVYSLWMTASTSKGEGLAGHKARFSIQQESQLFLPLVCLGVSLVTVSVLLCLCQCSAVKQRFWVYLQCLMLAKVPDPKNSKWAKECSQEKGKMSLLLQLSISSSSTVEEEEPSLVDVEEIMPGPSIDPCCTPTADISSSQQQLTPQTLFYPLTTYIKSFSHDSDSSEHTHISSVDTSTTTGYISSQGMGNMDEEDEDQDDDDEEEEEDYNRQCEMMGFFPSHNIVMEPLAFGGGKLTLDAVKIDCNNFFQNC